MRAGNLRQTVTLQLGETVTSGFGDEETTWTDLATYAAEVRPTFGAGEATHRVSLRAGPAIDPLRHRLIWDGRILDILRADDPTGRGAELRLDCREILDGDEG